jgi:hypothetical protein
MSVGGIRGGGGKGRAGGPKGASGKAAGKAGGAGFGGKVSGADKADATQGLVGPSGAAGSGNVGGVDAVTAQALELARQLKSGEIGSKEEATRKLVADILKEKLRMQSKALTSKIAEQLQDDPRLNQALERLWQKG